MASSSEAQPQEQQQQLAPGLPRAEFIEDVGKFLEGEQRGVWREGREERER